MENSKQVTQEVVGLKEEHQEKQNDETDKMEENQEQENEISEEERARALEEFLKRRAEYLADMEILEKQRDEYIERRDKLHVSHALEMRLMEIEHGKEELAILTAHCREYASALYDYLVDEFGVNPLDENEQ